jgi:hypothetical protein
MSVFGSGTQSDWYAAGILLIQLAFLVAGVWFASNFLKAIRGFQEQVGALVKLSVTNAPAEPGEASRIARRTLGEGSVNWAVPAKTEITGVTETVEREANRVSAGSARFLRLGVPTIRGSERTVALPTEIVDKPSAGSWQRRIGSWLQTPMHASVVNPEATGLRRMMQWLGAVAGS